MIQLSKAALPLKGGCVLTIGNFDGVHIGHRALIQKTAAVAKEMALPSVVWTFDKHPQSFFGAKDLLYLTGNSEKAAFIKEAGADMYYCASFAEYKDMDTAQFVKEALIGEFGVKAVLCGYDFSFGRGGVGTPKILEKLLAEYGIGLTVLPPVCHGGEPVSSTRLRAVIKTGDMETARALLGRAYSFYLPVCEGKRLGRAMGAPTVNQSIPKERAVPAYGVYASFCEIDGKLYPAVSNIGVKPTVSLGGAPLCETHILDYKGDLYGQRLWVHLYKRIRAEKRFDGIEALSAQIAADIEAARLITKGVSDV